MRILMVTSYPVPGDCDGTAMLSLQVLRAIRKVGIEVGHAYLKARRPWKRPERGEVEGIPSWTLAPPSWIGGLRAIRREFPFDLVHADHYGGATRAYAACRLGGWPMVYQIHSLLGDEFDRNRLGRGLAFRGYRAIERRVFQTARAVIGLGDPVKRVVVDEKGVPEGRAFVIHPTLELSEYDRPGPPAEIPGVGPDDRVIMYIGNLEHPNQGVPVLVDALPRVFDAVADAKCVLVGGPASAAESYREQLGHHGDRLVAIGGRSPAEIVGLTRRADVLVHPRRACRENYSVQTKLGVYLAAGRPIVATDFGDYPRLLGQTGAGRLTAVDPDALAVGLIDVLTDPALAARLAAASRPVAVEHFGAESNGRRYLDVYRAALAAGPR